MAVSKPEDLLGNEYEYTQIRGQKKKMGTEVK
jgi:hypothetical protein